MARGSRNIGDQSYVPIMKEAASKPVTILILLFTPNAAVALSRSCSMLPTLADWMFNTAYLGCAIALLGIGLMRLMGRLRPRSLLYPVWAAVLLVLLQVAANALWLDMIRQGQPMCYPH